VNLETSNLVHLTYNSKSHPANEKSSLKGAWSWSADPFYNFTPDVKLQRLTLDTSNFVHRSAMRSLSLVIIIIIIKRQLISRRNMPEDITRARDEWVFPNWAWWWSREQFLHCGLRNFGHSKSSEYRWYPQLDRCRFVYDTYKTMTATWSRHGWVQMFITHCLQLNLRPPTS